MDRSNQSTGQSNSLEPTGSILEAVETYSPQGLSASTAKLAVKTRLGRYIAARYSMGKSLGRARLTLPVGILIGSIILGSIVLAIIWHTVQSSSNSPIALLGNPKFGVELVWVPAGTFSMGSTPEEIDALLKSDSHLEREAFVKEMPQHKVYLDAYYIFKTPVTVKQYLTFCEATGYTKPEAPDFNRDWSKQDHPIVNVSWEDANAFCEWISKETGLVVTLPTEAQWEKAARGTKGLKFPWGNTFDGSRLQHSIDKVGDAAGTAPVGSFPTGASPYGALHMAGNVCQWCSDLYDDHYYNSSPNRNPPGAATGTFRSLRGSSWLNKNENYFRCANRIRYSPYLRNNGDGFRCVVRPSFQ